MRSLKGQRNPRAYAIGAALVGNMLEYYDFMVYAFLMPVLAPLFFPTDNAFLGTLLAVGSFSVSYLMRPLGGVVFGYIGDKFGRRMALLLVLCFNTIPLLIIGFLPIYAVIGLVAPIILILCRAVQGFCIGGEVGGSITYIFEHAGLSRAGLAGGLFISSCYLGMLIASGLNFLVMRSPALEWGWRIPFLMGAGIGLIGLILRHTIRETPLFLGIKEQQDLKTKSLFQTFLREKINLLCAFFISGCLTIPFFIIFIYLNSLLIKDLHISLSHVLLMNMVVLLFWVLLAPISGWLADKIGHQRLMCCSSFILMFISIPLFILCNGKTNAFFIFFVQIILSILYTGFNAPSCALLSSLFSTHLRYRGIGFATTSGAAVFGGLLPLLITAFSYSYGSNAVGIYLTLSALAGLIATIKAHTDVQGPSAEKAPELLFLKNQKRPV